MDIHGTPNVYLSGGQSPYIDEDDRLRHVPDPYQGVLKVLCGNRYEHFKSDAETTVVDDRELHVFSWTHSTYLAE